MTATRKMTAPKILNRRTLREGEVLIREGELGDAAFFIQSGRFEVLKRDRDKDICLTHLGKNAIVGEMALIDNNRRSATVRCVESGTVVTLDRATFESKLKHLDKFSRALLEMFSNKLRTLNDEFLQKTRATPAAAADAPPAAAPQKGVSELLEVWGRASPEERLTFWQTVTTAGRTED